MFADDRDRLTLIKKFCLFSQFAAECGWINTRIMFAQGSQSNRITSVLTIEVAADCQQSFGRLKDVLQELVQRAIEIA